MRFNSSMRRSSPVVLGLLIGLLLSTALQSGPAVRLVAESQATALADPEVQSSDYERAVEMAKGLVFRIAGPEGTGSGFIIHPGYLITNEHVIVDNAYGAKADPFILPLPFVPPLLPPPRITLREKHYEARCFSGSDEVEGRKFAVAPVVLADGTRAAWGDVALLRIPPDVECRASPLPIGRARVGMPVMVIGNPAEEDNVTFGRVSKLKGVPRTEGNPRWQGTPMIGTDAAINPGNSGGPMFGLRRLIVAGKPELKVELIGMSTYRRWGSDNLGGGIDARHIAYVATTRWRLPLMTAEQVEAYRRERPEAR